MTIRLGDTAPDFTADTTQGTINFHEWLGDSWGVLFSHPEGLHPGLHDRARLHREDQARVRQAQHEGHRSVGRSRRLAREVGGRHRGDAGRSRQLPDDRRSRQEGRRPLRHDPPERERHRDGAHGVRHRPDKKVEAHDHLPASRVGRNFDEILRVIDSLQLTAGYSVATPVNWKDGEDVIIMPSVSDDDAKGKFPKGWKALKPYLRLTPQPNK